MTTSSVHLRRTPAPSRRPLDGSTRTRRTLTRVAGYTTLVIVSDWLMPEMKGDEFLIKAHNKFPHVLTLMLTGQADHAAVERSRNPANLHKLIDKPWDAADLIDAIKSGLAENGAGQPI